MNTFNNYVGRFGAQVGIVAHKVGSSVTRNAKRVGAGLVAVAAAAVASAQATVETIVTDVTGITADASTAYIAAAGLGVAALTVGAIVFMSRKGWKLR